MELATDPSRLLQFSSRHHSWYDVGIAVIHIQIFIEDGVSTANMHEKQTTAYLPPCCCISICPQTIAYVLETIKITICFIHIVIVFLDIIYHPVFI
jgi:hypothetical protein